MGSIYEGPEEMYDLGDDGRGGVLDVVTDSVCSDLDSILTSISRGASAASSLYSGPTDYTYENGRRYHAFRESVYNFPNDEVEQDRLDIAHYQNVTILDGKLHLCPLSNPRRILDVGTGTGIWAIDMANLYETAEIIGTDLSPIQPHWVPPNCRFEVDDAEGEWCFAKESFDMIHARHMVLAIKDWQRFVEQVYDHLVPGGWVQLCEHDFKPWVGDETLLEACTIRETLDRLGEAFRKIGVDPSLLPKMRTYLERQGFVDIHELHYEIPWGSWPRDKKLKEIGRYSLLMLEYSVEAFATIFTRVLGYPVEEAMEWIRKTVEEVKTQKHHAYVKGIILIARKPRMGEVVGEIVGEGAGRERKEVGDVEEERVG